MCVYAFIQKKKKEKEGATCSIKGTESPGDRALSLCMCSRVFVCACQPVPAQYPSIQPAPGTVVHPTRRTVALFISETHSLCVSVCVRNSTSVCVYVCRSTAFGIPLNISTHTHIQQTQTHSQLNTHTYRFPRRFSVLSPTFLSPLPAVLHPQ